MQNNKTLLTKIFGEIKKHPQNVRAYEDYYAIICDLCKPNVVNADF